MQGTLENVVLRDSLGRLAGYLLSLDQTDGNSSDGNLKVKLSIKKRDLASHLALAPETLSRTFSRLTELGAIRQITPSEIEILLPDTLKNLQKL